ncbi:MAG: c-type cytochrome [Verrucomicrobiales bacterium]|nr:c-type cytochrome [Verrucomicrobiales bacterium]
MNRLTRLVAFSFFLTPALQAAPQWIWLGKKAENQQKVSFRKEFELPQNAHFGSLKITCDNGAKAYLNGQLVATNPDWQQPTTADVTKQIKPGEKNELRIDATNQGSVAALIAQLTVTLASKKDVVIETDGSWQAVTTGSDDWQPATVVAQYGDGPWGKALEHEGKTKKSAPEAAIAAADITVPPGFTVDQLYVVPKEDQGSWVTLTVDDRGRLIAGDQYGALYRMEVPAPGQPGPLKPERLNIAMGKAHGLLHAHGALYVMVNENGAENGLYRLTDTDGDDQYDRSERLVTMSGGGEHGLHSMTLSPDGQRIWFNGGNHCDLPERLDRSRPAILWSEDHLLPRMWDANGHARGRLAPGGFIASMNPDGSDVELFCTGFRNEFDIAFNGLGDLFTYDADMEWDIGTPWYRATRINHAVSGADFGWRAGSGKWPEYYPDSLPTTLDIGPGSPTGVTSGQGAKFPARYQNAIFANDWTYGTMWAIHLRPDGASYQAEKEEFVFGKPLPLTDVVIHPPTGTMIFAIGGRRTQSAVYRVTYTGSESTAAAPAPSLTEEMKMRRMLEQFHQPDVDAQAALDKAWSYLSHSDRHLRYAARVAIEKLPIELWQQRALDETHPQALIEAIIALARAAHRPEIEVSGKPKPGESFLTTTAVSPENEDLQQQMLKALGRLRDADLSRQQRLAALRAAQLIFTRLGKPKAETAARVAQALEPLYPSGDPSIDRELCQLLVFLDSPKVVGKTLSLMATATDDWQDLATPAVLSRHEGYARAAQSAAASRPNRQQIALMFALRNATAGWTPEHRHTFFSWFPHARTWKGGNSFKGFIENIRTEALANFVPETERATLEALSAPVDEAAITAIVPPHGPGQMWTLDDATALGEGGFKGRNFEHGQAMFRTTMCLTCHRFNGDGGGIGPDLTGAGNRYTLRDLLENIITPSKVISDQYDSQLITKTDGTIILGRIVLREDGVAQVMTNPFAPTALLSIRQDEIAEVKTQPISLMPPGLINVLGPDDLKDLLAYILSGGNPEDPAFKP